MSSSTKPTPTALLARIHGAEALVEGLFRHAIDVLPDEDDSGDQADKSHEASPPKLVY